jgi:ATP-dependent Clp protease ATP-binding subunit ClpA
MTSNLGAEEFGKKKASIWFSSENSTDNYSDGDWKKITERIWEHVKDFISPELQNRIDYNIIFKPITKDLMKDIFKIKLDEFLWVWSKKSGITTPEFDDKKVTEIINKIYNPQFWARPIEKYIYDTIEPELIEQVMNPKK